MCIIESYTCESTSNKIGVLGGNQSNTLSSKLMGTKDIAYVVRPKRTSASLTAAATREI